MKAYLSAKTEGDEHEEKQDGPEPGSRQMSDHLRVDNECQACAYNRPSPNIITSPTAIEYFL